jgi:hypothetical protein
VKMASCQLCFVVIHITSSSSWPGLGASPRFPSSISHRGGRGVRD